MAASEEIRKRLREGGQVPPSPIKPSQAIRERIKAEKPEPKLPASEVLRRKIDKDPESLYERYNQGDAELDQNQLKIVFDKQREQPLIDQAVETAKVFFPRALEIGGSLIKGAAKFTKESAVDQVAANPAGALSDIVGLPVDAVAEGINKVSTSLGGNRVYETQYGPGQQRPFGGSKFFHPWDRNAKQKKEAAEAELALRSVASGIANDLEETAGSAVKFYNYGSALTDRLQEAVGTKTEKESFNDFVNRTYMTQEAQARAKENPDRAAALLAENPLVRPVMAGISALQGVELTPEELDVAQEDYKQAVLAKSIVPDKDMALLGEILNPIGLPARLVGPVSKAIEKPFQKGADLTAKTLAGTIKGVHPIEGIGIGLEKASEFSRKSGRKLSQVLTGDPDTMIKDISLVPQVPTYLPGKILKTTGRLIRDAGRQIDAQGMRGRKGIAERLGEDAASGEFGRRFFGTTRGGLMRARSADWIGRYSGAIARSGTSGAALNVMLGLPEIENPTQLGQSLGTGVAIGAFVGSDPVGRVSALLDPTIDFATRVDRVLTPDAGARRLDEDADIARFMALADDSTKAKINSFSDVSARIAILDEQIAQFQRYRDSTEKPRNWKFWQDEMNTLIRQRNLLDKNKNNKQFVDEVKRQVTLDFADALEQLKAIGNQAGLGSPTLKILDDSNAEEEVRKIWGKTLTDAEFFRSQLVGKPTLEPNEAELLQKANQTIQVFGDLVEQAKSARGFALHRNLYLNTPAHLVPANLDSPVVALNGNLLSHLGREGFNPGHTLRHEAFHVLKQLSEVRDALNLEQVEQQMFGRKIKDEAGRVIAEIPGVYTAEDVFRYGQNYAARMGGQSFIDQFDSTEKFYEYIREEMLSENYATSGNIRGGLRAAADSTGQALVDWIEAKTRNGSLKRLKEVLRQRGIIFNDRGEFSAILGAKIDPESSALMRRVQRLLRDEVGAYTFETDGTNPDGTEKVRDQGEVPWAAVMANPALQEHYIADDRFVKDQVLVVYDDAGKKISEVVLPDGVGVDPYIAQYYVKNGKIVDESGNEIILGQPVNLSALPDGSRVQADFKIRRNPDGTPVVISPREANARATKRGKMIYDAIVNAPEDGMPKMRDQDDNGVLTGVMSPSQLQAVLNLPNSIVPARLKRIIAAGNAMLERKDGTRAIIDYQAVYRGGKARSLAPRVRDIVPLSWRISKKQNFLFTSISVSRMFDKLNVWSAKFPENLTLWGGDTFKFWQDLLKVLSNHNAGLTADGKNSSGQYVGERLDVDDAIAELKKHRINDFFNLFDKGTEALNPMRTKIKAKRGQDSPDRLIMSARVDRINHFEESASQKLPVDYGKMKVNFMPNLGYSIPSDPRTLMADFYLVNYLSGFSDVPYQQTLIGQDDKSLARFSGENPEPINFLRSEDYRPIVKVTQDRLQTFLKEHLLDQVFFALSAEIRHAIKRKQDPSIYGPIMNQYIKYFSAYDSPSSYEGRKPSVPEYFQSSEEARKKSWQATTRALEKFSGKEFARARRKDLALEMAKVFREGIWSGGYGGEKWAKIAEAFVLLHYANTPEKIAFAIDKVYDLQHNTNTVFNKVEKYAKDGGYRWVLEMLDFKYHLQNPRELLPLASSDLKKLALLVLKDFGTPTKESLAESAKAEVGPKAVEELFERIKKMKPQFSIYSNIGVDAPKDSGRNFSAELSRWLASQLSNYRPEKNAAPEAFIQLARLLISEKMGMGVASVGPFASKEIKQIFDNVKKQKSQETTSDKEDFDTPVMTDAGVKVADSEILEAAQALTSGKNSVKFGDYTFKLENSAGYNPQGEAYNDIILGFIDETGAMQDETNPLEEGFSPTNPSDSYGVTQVYYDFIKKSLGIDKKQPFTNVYLNFIAETLATKEVGEKIEFQEYTPNGLTVYSAVVVDEIDTGEPKPGSAVDLPEKIIIISKKVPDGWAKVFDIQGSGSSEFSDQLKEKFRALKAGAFKATTPQSAPSNQTPVLQWTLQWTSLPNSEYGNFQNGDKPISTEMTAYFDGVPLSAKFILNGDGVYIITENGDDYSFPFPHASSQNAKLAFIEQTLGKKDFVYNMKDYEEVDFSFTPPKSAEPNLDIIPPSWNESNDSPETKAWKAKWELQLKENFPAISPATTSAIVNAIIDPNTGEVAKNLVQVKLKLGPKADSFGESLNINIKQAIEDAKLQSDYSPAMEAIVNKTAKELLTKGSSSMLEPNDDNTPGLEHSFTLGYDSEGQFFLTAKQGGIGSSVELKGTHVDYSPEEKVTAAIKNAIIEYFTGKNPGGSNVWENSETIYDKPTASPATPANEPVFGTTDPYVYHLTGSHPETLASIFKDGLLPSEHGYAGPGVYFGNTPDATEVHDFIDSPTSTLLRIKKDALINAFGKYSAANNTSGLQFDDSNGDIYLATEDMKDFNSIPADWIEYKDASGVWIPLAENPINKKLQDPIGEKEVYQLQTEEGEFIPVDNLFVESEFPNTSIFELWKLAQAWPPNISAKDIKGLDPWELQLFKKISAKLGSKTDFANFATEYAEFTLNLTKDYWSLMEGVTEESFNAAMDLAALQDSNAIVKATSFDQDLYLKFVDWKNPSSGKNPPAAFMPSEEYGLESGEEAESRLTPKVLYNLYYISTEGDPGNDYGRSLQNEYVNKYKKLYLDVFSDLVKNQINKYIRKGRVDPFVTKEALQSAKSASQLDELMRGTYRSDMRRRNTVWNYVTEYLKELESAKTLEQRLFYMDRLNNAIHNTNELLFSKFSNASSLLQAFDTIANARDIRAYVRNVDRDLRLATTFGGSPGSFMPSLLQSVGLTTEHLQNLNIALQDSDRLKSMVSRYVKTGNEEDFTAIVIDPVFSALMQIEPGQRLPLPSLELRSWLQALRVSVLDKDAADIKRTRSAITRILNNPTSFNSKEISEIISGYVNEGRNSQHLWRLEGAAPYTGEPIESFRGIALNGPLLEGLKVGDAIEIDSPGYESWSTDPKTATRFATKVSNTGMGSFGSTIQWLRNSAQAEKENRKGLPGDYGVVLSTVLDSNSVAIDVSKLSSNSRYVNESELIARPGKKLVTVAAIYRDRGDDLIPETIEKSLYRNRDITITLDSKSVDDKLHAAIWRRGTQEYEKYSQKLNRIDNAFETGNTAEIIKMLSELLESDGIDADISKVEGSDVFEIRVKNTNPLDIHRYFGMGNRLDKIAQGTPQFMPASKSILVDRVANNAKIENRLKGEAAWLLPKGWVNVSDHLDIFPEDLYDLRRIDYEDLKDRNFVRVRRIGKTLWYEGNPTRKMLKELKDTAIEKKLTLEKDPGEFARNSASFMPSAGNFPRVFRSKLESGEPKEYEIRGFHSTSPEYLVSILDKGIIPGFNEPPGQDWKGEYSGKGIYFHRSLPLHEVVDNGYDSYSGDPFVAALEFKQTIPAASIVPDEEVGFPADAPQIIQDTSSALVAGDKIQPENIKRIHIVDTPASRQFIEESGIRQMAKDRRISIVFHEIDSDSSFSASFMPSTVPTQKQLDEMKARLPEYRVEVKGPDDIDDVEILIYAGKNGRTPIGRALLNLEPEDGGEDTIEVRQTKVKESHRRKGYGEALYREIAKLALKNKKKFLYGSTVSEDAARVRRKLFAEEETMQGPWEQDDQLMLSRLKPRAKYMPASNQVDPGLAEVTGPDTDQGPLSGARFMPAAIEGTFYHGIDKNKSRKIPKNLTEKKAQLYPPFEKKTNPSYLFDARSGTGSVLF
jgi:predicted GNAT family acetyltransferase